MSSTDTNENKAVAVEEEKSTPEKSLSRGAGVVVVDATESCSRPESVVDDDGGEVFVELDCAVGSFCNGSLSLLRKASRKGTGDLVGRRSA